MDNGSREASEVIRLTMDGMQMVLKITGAASKELLDFFAALQKKGEEKTSGRQNLKKLLMTRSELKVFTIKGRDKFKRFAYEAKQWGVVYSVVRRRSEDKKNEIYEVLVRAEDAAKLNRMIEKYNLMADVSITDTTEAEESELVKARKIVGKMIEPTGYEKTERQMDGEDVPGQEATERESQSVADLMRSKIEGDDRSSVRKLIDRIKSGSERSGSDERYR